MNVFPKSRFSGFIVIIILFLILVMAAFTIITRMASEDKLIKLGFVKLEQYSELLNSKIKVLYTYKTLDWNNNKNYALVYKDYKWKIIKDTTKIEIPDNTYDFLKKTFFNDYIIFDEKNVLLYSSKTESPDLSNYLNTLKSNLYLPASYDVFNFKKENDQKKTYFNSGFISKSIINYEKYYQFVLPFEINNKRFYISGLLTNQDYLQKKQHVETSVLIVIGILLLFALLSFPFIKLIFLSKTERINTSDMVLLCFSISGIACIVTLLILNMNTLFRIKANCKDQLISLSDSIKSNFVSELNLMYQTLEEYENFDIINSEENKDSRIKIPKSNASTLKLRRHVLTDTIVEKSGSKLNYMILAYPYFKGLFCGNSDWATDIITTWKTDTNSRISYRDYYSKKDEWSLPGTAGEKRFRLQSIYSNTTGDASAVLAKPSKDHSEKVYCISSPMVSIMNTILPPGFEFRIIGQDGQVWFHNDQQKNTRENFLYECDHKEEIQEAIHNRVETSFSLKISLKNYQMHISPIGTMPLYLVTLSDTQEQNEFLSHINYMLFIFILIGVLFAIIATLIFYFEKVENATRTKDLNDEEPGLIWLVADSRKNKKYIIVCGLNILLGIFISLGVLLGRLTILHFLLILFSAYSICFIYTFILLKSTMPKMIKNSILITFGSIVFVCNIIYFFCFSDILFFVLEFFVITILALIVVIVKTKDLFPEFKSSIVRSRFKFLWSTTDPYLPYALSFTSWLVTGCILPTFFLFKIAGKEEVDLNTRKSQLELASKIESKGILIDSFYIAHIYPDNYPGGDSYLNILKAEHKRKGNYLLNVSSKPVFYKEETNELIKNDKYSNFMLFNKYLRQGISKEDYRSYQMLYGAGLDISWYWTGGYLRNKKSDVLTLHYKGRQKDQRNFYSGYQFSLSSKLREQKTMFMKHRVRSVIFNFSVYLIFIVFLFLLIRVIIEILFILEKPKILNSIKGLRKIPESVNTFLINTLSHEYIRKKKTPYMVFESDQLPAKVGIQNVVIILNPLPEKPAGWNLLIDSIEKLLKRESGQVILLCTLTPVQISEKIEEQIQSTTIQYTKDALSEININLNRLFSHFIVCFMQDQPNGKVFSRVLNLSKSGLDNELVIGNIEGALLPKSRKKNKNGIPGSQSDLYDLLISQYQYLWRNCTINEKFILFDLSTDSLVNTKNKEDIKNLIGKGILDVNGKLGFVSKGFKRYVMDLLDSEEFISMKNNSKRMDGWNKIKNPLYIIFAAIVVFFFFTQHDLITGINGAIISITGILGTLMKVLSGKTSGGSS